MTPFDIENLNRSMEGVGQAFSQNRAQALQAQHFDIENAMRQRMLDAEERRMSYEQTRDETMAAPKVTGLLRDADNPNDPGMAISGTYDSIQQIVSKAKQSGKNLTIAPAPIKGKFGDVKVGNVTFHPQNQQEYDKIVEQAKAHGIDVFKQTQSPSYGPVQADKAATDLENQADQLDQQAQGIPTPSLDRVAASQQSAKLRQRAAALRASMQRPDASQFETQTTTTHQDPKDLMSPEVKTTRRVPVGSAPPAAAPAAPAALTSAPPDPSQRVAGKKYQTPKGVFTWTGTGWQQ